MSTFEDKAPRDTLRVITPEEVRTLTFDPVDALARDQASAILNEVQTQGVEGLLNVAVRLRDIESRESKIFYSPEDLKVAFESLDSSVQKVLERTAARIRLFAENQRASLQNMTMVVPGGEAGHTVEPIQVAGCYAPGGRYPLPSSVLMTAVTARAAGVPNVYVASPRPAPATLGAAYVAKADGLLAIGGAGAIGAFAYGLKGNGSNCPSMPAADVIVGPGNKWVTAAKSIVSGIVGIDMLAGPSEVLVIADETGDAQVIAADLLAQAEHDTEARPILLSTSADLIERVNSALTAQLSTLPTAPTARAAVAQGFAVLCEDLSTAIAISDRIGPEHLEIQTKDSTAVAKLCKNYGAIFIGTISAEVLGDYGLGPNHVLPTSGTSRYTGGLSVFTFLRIRTWMNITDKPAVQEVVEDSVALARIEGLEGHARAAEARLLKK